MQGGRKREEGGMDVSPFVYRHFFSLVALWCSPIQSG
jgi:hypothetical protein